MDSATQLVDVLEKGIDVGASKKVQMRRASLKAKIRLEFAMGPMKASGLAAGSPNSTIAATANQLLSDLERFCDLEDEISQVTVHCNHKIDVPPQCKDLTFNAQI